MIFKSLKWFKNIIQYIIEVDAGFYERVNIYLYMIYQKILENSES